MKKNIKEWLKQRLNKEKYLHVIGTEKAAVELAKKFNVDENKASIAALLHDCAKYLTPDELYKIIKEKNIEVSEMEMECAKTLHAPVGAYFAGTYFDINDNEILDAIRYHTIGRINMTMLDKIIFLSDKIELETRDMDFSIKARNVLDKTNNIDEAILICYNATIKSLLDRKMVINPSTIDVYNYLTILLSKN
ncbi:MAG: bis(5'-nucleosyl)-tetraphosphatase (symmetrical) YqeK [Candidatus Gastranaerophilaceae bacterium]